MKKLYNPTSEENNPVLPILVIDSDVQCLKKFEKYMSDAGYNNLIAARSLDEALTSLKACAISVVVLDLSALGFEVDETLCRLMIDYPQIPFIITSSTQEVETAVECMKHGAFDFLTKPVDKLYFLNTIRHALEIKNLRTENLLLHDSMMNAEIKQPECFSKIITASRKMQAIFLYIQSIAVTSQPVLITGETGVGKELIAESVHLASRRKGKLVTLNVAGLDDTTFSDTLFGHRPGAYTDAKKHRGGLIETAYDGTIFLDEIGDLKESSQIKILRLIQEKEYYPLGGDVPVKTNARIITATNSDLQQRLDTGAFRSDLYYRLRLHHIGVPPLRERPEDIKILAASFISEACRELQIKKPKVSNQFYAELAKYPFPGNVRELQAIVYESLIRSDGAISLNYIRFLLNRRNVQEKSGARANNSPLTTLEQNGQVLIARAVEESGGNLSRAARKLGISRSTLYRKLKKQ